MRLSSCALVPIEGEHVTTEDGPVTHLLFYDAGLVPIAAVWSLALAFLITNIFTDRRAGSD
jgi:hypothetical protein